MTGEDEFRPVWLSRDQRDKIEFQVGRLLANPIVAAWDQAPADPSLAIAQAVCVEYQLDEEDAWTCVPAVLVALGFPEVSA